MATIGEWMTCSSAVYTRRHVFIMDVEIYGVLIIRLDYYCACVYDRESKFTVFKQHGVSVLGCLVARGCRIQHIGFVACDHDVVE